MDRSRGRARRTLLTAVVLLALAPLTALVATRLHHVEADPLLTAYGVLMLGTVSLIFFLAFARYSDPSLDPPVTDQSPHVTVLLAVKDEIDVIDRCVGSVLAQTYADLELIVIDDGSTDGTGERLATLAASEPRLRLITLEVSEGKKRALTIGVAEATGDILAFTDSDCIIEPDAMEILIRAFNAHPEMGALSGHARALNADATLLTRIQDTWYETSFSVMKAAESTFGGVTCVSGPLAAFRREAIYNYFPAWANDMFLGREFRFATDRQLTGYVLGQRYEGARLKAQYADSPFVTREDHPPRHWDIGYVRSARVVTVVPETMRQMTKQQVRWKKSFLRNLFFTGRFYWRRGLTPTFIYYGHVLFVLAAPFMFLRHLVWMPLHGEHLLAVLYLAGVTVKGGMWGLAYWARNPGEWRWVYRPLMSLISALLFSWMLIYSALTLRKGVWARG